ncbi:MAG: hypothetical protein ACOY9D_12040 [Pseudomonadota bacterium]
MTYIDLVIPGVAGLLLLVWPQSMFMGSRVKPDPSKIRLLRGLGIVLLLAAAIYLVIKLGGA